MKYQRITGSYDEVALEFRKMGFKRLEAIKSEKEAKLKKFNDAVKCKIKTEQELEEYFKKISSEKPKLITLKDINAYLKDDAIAFTKIVDVKRSVGVIVPIDFDSIENIELNECGSYFIVIMNKKNTEESLSEAKFIGIPEDEVPEIVRDAEKVEYGEAANTKYRFIEFYVNRGTDKAKSFVVDTYTSEIIELDKEWAPVVRPITKFADSMALRAVKSVDGDIIVRLSSVPFGEFIREDRIKAGKGSKVILKITDTRYEDIYFYHSTIVDGDDIDYNGTLFGDMNKIMLISPSSTQYIFENDSNWDRAEVIEI